MAVLTMIEAVRDALGTALEADDRVLVLGQDVGRLGGVFRATDGLQARFGADRVVDMVLAEGVIVGAGIGLAAAGLRPVVELQFLGFSFQAFHQIAQQVARLRYRSQGSVTPSLVIRAPFGGGVRTPEMHADAVEGLFTHCPGLKVVLPSTAHDAKGLLLAAIEDPDPVLFLEPLRGYRLVKDEVPDGRYTVPFGQARTVREGDDVTLVAWSAAVQVAEKAAAVLAAEGVSAHVLDLRSLVPLDIDGLAKAVARTGRCVVAHEAPLTSGFGAEVVATVMEECFWSLEAPIRRVTAPDTPYPLAGAEDLYLPDVAAVAAAARATVALS